jgi:hypothetical protein
MSKNRSIATIIADLTPWADTRPEDMVAETSYRRGFHQGLATAVNLITDLGSADALSLLLEAKEIASYLRRAKKTYPLMQAVYDGVVNSRRQPESH